MFKRERWSCGRRRRKRRESKKEGRKEGRKADITAETAAPGADSGAAASAILICCLGMRTESAITIDTVIIMQRKM